MRAHPRRQPPRITHALNNASHERRAVQLAHLLGHADVLVDEGLVVGDHVLVLGGGGALERVGGAPEQVFPEGGGDELEEGEDACGAEGGAGGFAVEEEGEEAQAEGVALFVEAFLGDTGVG